MMPPFRDVDRTPAGRDLPVNPNPLPAASHGKAVVVLGMHRSGTSAVTRALKALGVELGDRLIPGQQGINDKGYWEDAQINALNHLLLMCHGMKWHSLRPIEWNALAPGISRRAHQHALHMLQTKFQGQPVWGFKDPRISRLLGFWKDVIQQSAADVVYVIVCRNPKSVAQSLARRDGFATVKSSLSWLQHMVTAISETHDARRVFIDYDLLMADPNQQLARLAEAIQVPIGQCDPASLREYCEQFLSRGLRHSTYSDADLELDREIPKNVVRAFRLIRGLSEGKVHPDTPAFREAWRQIEDSLKDDAPLLAYLDDLERNRLERWQQHPMLSGPLLRMRIRWFGFVHRTNVRWYNE